MNVGRQGLAWIMVVAAVAVAACGEQRIDTEPPGWGIKEEVPDGRARG